MKTSKKKIFSIQSIQIGLASPSEIKKWAEKKLPNGKIVGQVTKSQTVNYKTLRPEPGGLFCERIFGPINDFECMCGKKLTHLEQKFCLDCGVEFTSSLVRRYQLGYIKLIVPVTHIWFLKGRPNYISILLDLPSKKLEALAYCTNIIQNNKKKNINKKNINKKKLFYRLYTLKNNKKICHQFLKKNIKKKLFLHKKGYVNLQNIQKIINNFSLLKKTIRKNNTYYSLCRENTSWELHDFGEIEFYFFLRYITNTNFLKKDKSILKYKNIIEKEYKSSVILKWKKNKLFINIPEGANEQGTFGGEAIKILLKNINLFILEKILRKEIPYLKEKVKNSRIDLINFYLNEELLNLEQKEKKKLKKILRKHFELTLFNRTKKIRQLKLVQHFRKTENRPEWMVISILPVLPPALRPIIQLNSEQVAVSDLNKLYQKVLYRNKRLKRFSSKGFQDSGFHYEQRLLQEAVDALLDNGKGGTEPVCASNGRPLKSLSNMLKGKKGRFRQNLLGKRVDYSGRSVIVVDPTLKLHQCGLPKELAIELFQPFLIKELLIKEEIETIIGAKKILQKKKSFVLKLLEQLIESHPILLNRAPTLHRMGFQAFQPKLIEGRAILLHPLVCSAFNADFDGDQMAVHIPLSFEARAEAWGLLWARNNLLSPATGQPNILPSQDMILGCYFLTTKYEKKKKQKKYFANINEALAFFYTNQTCIHELIWIQWILPFETLNKKENILEIQVQQNGIFITIYSEFLQFFNNKILKNNQYIRTSFGRIIFNNLLHEFFYKKK